MSKTWPLQFLHLLHERAQKLQFPTEFPGSFCRGPGISGFARFLKN